MGIWLRRGIWSIVLGFITAWLVAWGITTASWAGWYQPQMQWRAEGIGIAEPWILEKRVQHWPGSWSESWSGERFDRAIPAVYGDRQLARLKENAERILEIGGAAFAEERKRELEAVFPELDEMMDGQLTQFQENMENLTAGLVLPPPQRIDDEVSLFPPPILAAYFAFYEADHFNLTIDSVGWPRPMLTGVMGWDGQTTEAGYAQSQRSLGSIEIPSLKRAPLPGFPPMALSLPYVMNLSAAIWNTTFFGGLWFALFTGVAALRSLRRRMAGQCPRCGYDLKRVVGKTRPECGRTSR
jgi:hypothetical protein